MSDPNRFTFRDVVKRFTEHEQRNAPAHVPGKPLEPIKEGGAKAKKRPVAKKPTADKPVAKKPAAKKPAAKKTVTKKRTNKK